MSGRARTTRGIVQEPTTFENGFKDLKDENLNLSNANLGNEALRSLCETLEKNTTVKTLDLSHNQFDDQSIQYLESMLKKNKTITMLNLDGNWILDTGSHALKRAMEQNHSIIKLKFDRHLANEDDKDVIDTCLMRNGFGH